MDPNQIAERRKNREQPDRIKESSTETDTGAKPSLEL